MKGVASISWLLYSFTNYLISISFKWYWQSIVECFFFVIFKYLSTMWTTFKFENNWKIQYILFIFVRNFLQAVLWWCSTVTQEWEWGWKWEWGGKWNWKWECEWKGMLDVTYIEWSQYCWNMYTGWWADWPTGRRAGWATRMDGVYVFVGLK